MEIIEAFSIISNQASKLSMQTDLILFTNLDIRTGEEL